MMFLSTFVCAGGSIAYLFKGSERGDRLAVAAAELGVLFGVCTLTTGPLWGRKAWGVWWQWDARLTSSLLLFLMLVGVPAGAALRRPRGPKAGGGAVAVRGDQRAARLQERRHLADGPPEDDGGDDAGPAHARRVLERVRADHPGVDAAADHPAAAGAGARASWRRCGWTPKTNLRRDAHDDDDGSLETDSESAAFAAVALVAWTGAALAQEFEKVENIPKQEIPAGPFVVDRLRHHLAGGPRLRGHVAAGVKRVNQEIADLKRKVDRRGPRRSDDEALAIALPAVVALHLHPGHVRDRDRARIHAGREGDARRDRARTEQGRRARGAHGRAGRAPAAAASDTAEK